MADIFSASSKGVEVWGGTAPIKVDVPQLTLAGTDYVLADAQISAREIVDVRQCFNDVSYIYALGNDQSQCAMTLKLLAFFIDCNVDNTGDILLGLKEYSISRISENTSAQTITIGNLSVDGWLVGIDIGNFDVERGYCVVNAHFIIKLP